MARDFHRYIKPCICETLAPVDFVCLARPIHFEVEDTHPLSLGFTNIWVMTDDVDSISKYYFIAGWTVFSEFYLVDKRRIYKLQARDTNSLHVCGIPVPTISGTCFWLTPPTSNEVIQHHDHLALIAAVRKFSNSFQ